MCYLVHKVLGGNSGPESGFTILGDYRVKGVDSLRESHFSSLYFKSVDCLFNFDTV
jgi:hypothetical protein